VTFLHAVWSIVVWLSGFVLQISVALVCLPLMLFVPFEKLQGGWPSTVVGFIPLLTRSKRTVHWDQGFEPKRVSVFVANHTSMLDGHIAIHALPHPFCGVENASHLAIPGYGWLMRMANAIPIPKGVGRIEAVKDAARERASRGISVLAFPEAHRTMNGQLRPFRRGGFIMARDAGLPVVPFAIAGMYQVFPKGTWIVRPGHFEVYIGPTLETAGKTDDELEVLAAECSRIITAWCERRETVNPDPVLQTSRPGNRDALPNHRAGLAPVTPES